MASSTQTEQRHPSDHSFLGNDPSLPTSTGSLRRRPSFSLLRRSKSTERATPRRNVSGGKLVKKQRTLSRDQSTLKDQITSFPPRIPNLPPPPVLQSFGGQDPRPDSLAIISNRAGGHTYHPRAVSSVSKASMDQPGPRMYPHIPIPPVPGDPAELNGNSAMDPYARTESMTNRGRYSYASSSVSTINNPRRMRRRKDPTPFNVLIIGARNAGKTSFLEFLRKSLTLPSRKQRPQFRDDAYNVAPPIPDQAFPSFTSHYLETEMEGERIGVSLWDSKGLESNIVDLQLREMAFFVENKFQDTLTEESKVIRSPGTRDTHIHCVFLLLDPSRLDTNIATGQEASASIGNSFPGSGASSTSGVLDNDFDLQAFRVLQGKTTVIPVIAKADTITSAHMAHLKRAVANSLKRNHLDTLRALGLDEDDAGDHLDAAAINGQQKPRFLQRHDRTISVTSHLDSPTDSEKSFSADDFDLANPSKHARKTSGVVPYTNGVAADDFDQENSSPHGPKTSLAVPGTNGIAAETPSIPMSIISPDLYEPEIIGRKFPWGFADPYNADHCDFIKLKESVFADWLGELREASRMQWYENWRSDRLNRQAEKEVVHHTRNGGTKTWGSDLKSRY